jgi:hypothetical protein
LLRSLDSVDTHAGHCDLQTVADPRRPEVGYADPGEGVLDRKLFVEADVLEGGEADRVSADPSGVGTPEDVDPEVLIADAADDHGAKLAEAGGEGDPLPSAEGLPPGEEPDFAR